MRYLATLFLATTFLTVTRICGAEDLIGQVEKPVAPVQSVSKDLVTNYTQIAMDPAAAIKERLDSVQQLSKKKLLKHINPL